MKSRKWAVALAAVFAVACIALLAFSGRPAHGATTQETAVFDAGQNVDDGTSTLASVEPLVRFDIRDLGTLFNPSDARPHRHTFIAAMDRIDTRVARPPARSEFVIGGLQRCFGFAPSA